MSFKFSLEHLSVDFFIQEKVHWWSVTSFHGSLFSNLILCILRYLFLFIITFFIENVL